MNSEISDQNDEAKLALHASEFSDDEIEAAADPDACRWTNTETAYLYYCYC